MNQTCPHRLGRLLGAKAAMPLLPPLSICGPREIDDDIPEGRHPTVIADVDTFVNVTLHQRSLSLQSQMEPVIGWAMSVPPL
jgi:hypothetical protein